MSLSKAEIKHLLLDTNKMLFLSLSSAFITDAILAIWQLPESDCGRLW